MREEMEIKSKMAAFKRGLPKVRTVALVLGAFVLHHVQADIVYQDNFDRATVGSDWSRIGGNTKWGIDAGKLEYQASTTAESILHYNAGSTDGSTSWTMEAMINFPNVSAWSGVAFNINPTDPDPIYFSRNAFYTLRINPTTDAVQWLKYPGGGSTTPTTLVSTTSSNDIPVNTELKIVVQSLNNAGSFTFKILNGETEIYSTDRVNGTDPFSGGTVGYYSSAGAVDFINADSFKLTVIPEPATLGLVGSALAGLFILRRLF